MRSMCYGFPETPLLLYPEYLVEGYVEDSSNMAYATLLPTCAVPGTTAGAGCDG